MAKFLINSILLIAFSLMAANLGTANADLVQVRVHGVLTCSASGILPTAPPLVGVNLTLSCDGQQTTLGQALTNTIGFFDIIVNGVDEVLFHQPSDCTVYAQLKPALNCSIFPPTGVLHGCLSAPGAVGSVFTAATSVVFSLITID